MGKAQGRLPWPMWCREVQKQSEGKATLKKGRSSHLCKSYVSQDGGAIKRAKIPQRFIHRTEVFLVLDLHQSNTGRWEGGGCKQKEQWRAVRGQTREDVGLHQDGGRGRRQEDAVRAAQAAGQ